MQENRARYDQLHELQNQAMEKTEDADLRYRIGEAAAALGRQELAQAWYRAALGLNPTHADALARLSQARSAEASEGVLSEDAEAPANK
jgi:hypothetical protein